MSGKRQQKSTSAEINDPMLASRAVEEFAFGWRWLRSRIANGEIRSRKIGHNLIVSRRDVERARNISPADRELLKRALAKRDPKLGTKP